MNKVLVICAFMAIGILCVAFASYANEAGEPLPEIKVRIENSGNLQLPPAGKNAMVKINDLAGKCQKDITVAVMNGLESKGYQNPKSGSAAYYRVSGSVVYFDEASPEYFDAAYRSRYNTRLVEKQGKTDPLSSGISFLVNKARAKNYVCILDLKIETVEQRKNRTYTRKNRARIVAGVEGSYRAADEILPVIEQELINYVISIF